MQRIEFENSIRGFVAAGSGLAATAVIPGNDNGPRGRAPYSTVLLITDEAQSQPIVYIRPQADYWAAEGSGVNKWVGRDAAGDFWNAAGVSGTLSSPFGDLQLAHRVSRRATFSVQFYRSGAFDAARGLAMWVRSDVGALVAERIGIKVHHVGMLRQLDFEVSENYEERAGVDIMVDYWHDTSYGVGVIEELDDDALRVR